jgi:hypothetical protein
VLRFRRDHLYIGVEPERLTLVRLSSLWPALSSTRVIASQSIDIAPQASESARVDNLRHALGDSRWHDAQAHIVLDDRLVRYFVAERPSGARSMEEIRLAARLRFEDIFGVEPDAWTIRLDAPPLATRQLGCALRTTFVDELIAACAAADSPAVSITPYAVSEFNRAQSTIGRQDGWFAVLGKCSVWVARKKGDEWLSTYQHVPASDPATAFPQLMAQEFLRASAESAETSPMVWISGALGSVETQRQLAEQPARLFGAATWPGQSDDWSSAFRLALSPMWPACA